MTVAFIGAGVMGETLLAGFLSANIAAHEVRVAEKNVERSEYLSSTYGVTCTSVAQSVDGADLIVLAVKPQDIPQVLEGIAPSVGPGALVISVAAGITTSFIEGFLTESASVVRVMPNTPSLLGEGMSAVSAGKNCTPEQLNRVVTLMTSVGKVVVVPESDQDSVTAISGSGPAYIFYIAEAMITAGQSLGISPELSSELVIQTIMGAARMLRDSDATPEVLRQRVSSPNGVTVRAIETLDSHGVREAFVHALKAAQDRSRELGS